MTARRLATLFLVLWVAPWPGIVQGAPRAEADFELGGGPDVVFANSFDTAGSCQETDDPVPNAGLTEGLGSGGCPGGMVRVATFCIDRYEAALVDDSVPGGAPWSPYRNPGMTTVHAISAAGAVPQGHIDQIRAGAACAAAGKRLCTDAEWLRACRGPGNTTYPYGNVREPARCNDARASHPAVEYFLSSDSWVFSQLNHPCLNQQPDTVDRSGENPGCISAEGVYDLMGNLHEWTADPNGTFRGGFYVDTVFNGNGCLYTTTAHATTHFDYSTGFRCCAD